MDKAWVINFNMALNSVAHFLLKTTASVLYIKTFVFVFRRDMLFRRTPHIKGDFTIVKKRNRAEHSTLNLNILKTNIGERLNVIYSSKTNHLRYYEK